MEEMDEMSHSTFLKNTERILDDMSKNVYAAIKDRKQNLAGIKERRKLLQSQISNLSNRLISHIYKLEKQALKDLKKVENTITSKIQCTLTKFIEKASIMNEFHDNISAIKNYASQLQMFLGLKTVAQNIGKEEQNVKLLFKEANLQQFDLKCEINYNTTSDIFTLKPFSSVQIGVKNTSLSFKSSTDKQAQLFSISQALSENNSFGSTRLVLERNFKIAKGNYCCRIMGCTVLPNGKMIFADCDPNKRLVIFSADGTFEGQICLSPTRPYDIIGLDENIVAISVWNPTEIQEVNIKMKKIVRRFKTIDLRGGLIHLPDRWIYRNCNGLATMGESSRTISTFVKQKKNPRETYLATTGKHVFASNSEKDTITCYGLNGKMVWEYKNKRLMNTPFGITVDNHSNVYVVSSSNKNIVMISSDGLRSRHLLDTDFFSDSPRAISFDKERNKLVRLCSSVQSIIADCNV